jgi:hypothetical protein
MLPDDLKKIKSTKSNLNDKKIKDSYDASRKIGCIKMSFNNLSTVLGLQVGSIKFIERDNVSQSICLYHADERLGVWRIAEGCEVPVTRIDMNHFAPEWASILRTMGWTVTPPEENNYETDNL